MEHLSEIISAIIGFIAGGLSVHFRYQYKRSKTSQQHGNNIAHSGSLAAGYLNGNVTINNSSAIPRIPELSPQAKNIIIQFYKTNATILLTDAPDLIIERLQTNSGQKIEINDPLTINNDLDNLVANGILSLSGSVNTGHCYSWTQKGKNYTKELLNQN